MQINLYSNYLKPAGETAAISNDTAASGSADSFLSQIGQMLNADSPNTDVQNAEAPEGQSAALCCTDFENHEAGDPASLLNLIHAETVHQSDWDVSDTPTLWDMTIAPETDAEAAVLQIDCEDAKGILQPLTPEKTQAGKEPSQTGSSDTVSESSSLPMYLGDSPTEISAMPLKDRCQDIDGSAESGDIKTSIPDMEMKPVDIGTVNRKISENANNLLQEAFSGLQSEEATSEAKEENPDAIKKDLTAAGSVVAEKADTTPAASAVIPVKEKMAPLKTEPAQKGWTVDMVPATDWHPESEPQPSRTLVREGAETAEQSLLRQSSGISEKTSSVFPTVRKPEPDASVAVDTGKSEGANTPQPVSKDESNVHAMLQTRADSGLAAAPGKPQPPGTERAQEVHAAACHNSVRSADGSNAAVAAEPVAQPQSRQFIHQLADQIQVLVRDGKGDIRIQLKPDVLGRIEIKAETTPAGVAARITTETSMVKSYLENNIQVLQQTLADQGLRIDRILIVAQDSFDAQFSSGRNAHFGQAGSGRNGQNPESFGSASGSSTTDVAEEIALDRAAWLSMNPNNRFYTVA